MADREQMDRPDTITLGDSVRSLRAVARMVADLVALLLT